MNLEEISVNHYYDSLRLAQNFLISGALVSGMAFFSVIHGDSSGTYTLPFIDAEIASLDFFSKSILALYFACGVMCCYGVQKAFENWRCIEDVRIAARVLQHPNIFLAGGFIKAVLYGLFYMVSASLASTVFEISGWKVFVAGSLFATPYWIALNESKYLNLKEK